MHERHDLDLIAAHADGDLESDAALAEELIASCAECRTEFEAQREISALLRDAPAPAMSEDERALVRNSVLGQLEQPMPREEVAPVISLDSQRRSTRRWMAVGSVAAVMLAVVAVGGGVLNSLGTDASETFTQAGDAADEAAEDGFAGADRMELESAETMAADDAGAAFAADDAGASDTTEASEEAANEDLTTTTLTAAEASFLPYLDAGPDPISEGDLELYVTETLTALETGALAEELTPDWFGLNELPVPACVTSIEDPIFAVINATVDDETLQVLILRNAETDAYEAAQFVLPDCLPR